MLLIIAIVDRNIVEPLVGFVASQAFKKAFGNFADAVLTIPIKNNPIDSKLTQVENEAKALEPNQGFTKRKVIAVCDVYKFAYSLLCMASFPSCTSSLHMASLSPSAVDFNSAPIPFGFPKKIVT